MADYAGLAAKAHLVNPLHSDVMFERFVVPFLVERWTDAYCDGSVRTDLVVVAVEAFSYLFDIDTQRLVSAWGVSAGRHGGARDKSRMAGHPLSAGQLYHRGHAIPHTLGGQTDINLVPQLGSINIGPFRPLEKKAVATPGAFYFTHWAYGPTASQTPIGVDQGLLVPGFPPEITVHSN